MLTIGGTLPLLTWAEGWYELPKYKADCMNDEQLKKICKLISDHDDQPRFQGRRSIDKRYGEVIEITDRHCVPANGYPIVETIDRPNFEGESAAILIARVMSQTWLATEIERVLRES